MRFTSIATSACLLLAASWAQAQVPACLSASPAPTSAKIVYGGNIAPVNAPIEKIAPPCVRLNYSGSALWTTADAKGGISCDGKNVVVDYNAASKAFNGQNLRQYTPAACGPAQAAPSGAPPAPSGKVNIYYGKTIDMASVPLVSATSDCFQVDYSGNKMWFPKSAYAYRADFVGNPAGLDYNARRSTACGVAPPPIPPVAAATSPCPPCSCLRTTPAPKSALVTYGGKAQPVTVSIEKIMPSCLRFNYSGNSMWTTTDAKGGVSCVGNNVQLDYGAANSGAFNGMNVKQYTPAQCAPAQPVPSGPPPAATGPKVNIYYGKTIDMASVPLTGQTANCYQVDYSGNKMWFPKSALGYRSDFEGNPVGLDYNQRKNSAC